MCQAVGNINGLEFNTRKWVSAQSNSYVAAIDELTVCSFVFCINLRYKHLWFCFLREGGEVGWSTPGSAQ